MKLFEIVRKLFNILGIFPCQENINRTFHMKNVAILLYQIIVITTTGSYLVFRAESIYECGELVFVCMSHFICLYGRMTVTLNMSTMYSLIEEFEKFMQTRKS